MDYSIKKGTIVTIIVICGIGIVTYFLIRQHYDWSDPDPLGRTIANLMGISAAMSIFHRDNGQWPNEPKWKEQLQGFFDENYFLDAWGNKIKYVIKEYPDHTERFVYSCGANRLDEEGEGDDLVQEVREILQ